MSDDDRVVVLPTHGRPQTRVLPPRGDALPDVPDLPDSPPPNLVPSTTAGLSPTAVSRMLTAHGSSRPRPLIYGRQTIGGQFLWGTSLGGNLVLVFFVAEGPINAIPAITFDGFDHVLIGCTSRIYLGTASQTVDAGVAALNPNWTSGLPGQAYVVITVPAPTSSSPPFNPLNPLFLVEGRKVRDPRLDPTLVTRYYSVNPALCTADFMTANRFGMGTPDAYMDWGGTITDAANDCDLSLGRPTVPSGALTGASGTAPGNLVAGLYQYTYTFYNAAGVESLESPIASITIGGGSAALATIATGGAGIVGRRVYRSRTGGSAGAIRRMVKDITDNTTTTLIDVLADTSLGASASSSNSLYTMNITVSQQADMNAVLENLRANWMGVVVYNAGLYQFFVNKQKANSGLTFTDDPDDPARNLIGPPTFHLKLTEEVPTRIELTFVDSAKNYADGLAIAEFPGVAAGTLPKVVKRIEARGTDGIDQAQRLVIQYLNLGLNDKQGTSRTMFDGIRGMIMDRVTINSVLTGLSADYLITDIQQDGSAWIFKHEIYSDAAFLNVIQVNAPAAAGPYVNPFAAPENVPLASIADTLPATFPFLGSLYWQSARYYSLDLWEASHWSQTGLTNFIASRVNDGITNVKAFDGTNTTSTATLVFDAGAGITRTFGKCQVSFTGAPANNVLLIADYSDDGTTWFTPTAQAIIAGALLTTTYTFEWTDAGAHQYWRLRKGPVAESGADYSDVQFFDAQPDPFISHYEIWDNSGTHPRYYTRVEKSPLPTATNPINIGPLVTVDAFTNGENYDVLIKTVRLNLTLSAGANFGLGIAPSAAGNWIVNSATLQNPAEFCITGPGVVKTALTSGNVRGFVSQQSNAGTDGALITLRKSRGTPASPATINNGDEAARLSMQVYDGSNWLRQAEIVSTAVAAPAGGFATGIISFLTANGANPKEWLRLDNLGHLILYGATSGSVGLRAPSVGDGTVYALPSSDGSPGDVLSTNGSGLTSWIPNGGGGGGGGSVQYQDDYAGSPPTTTFTASGTVATNGTIAVIYNGLLQSASVWSVSGNVLTMTFAPIADSTLSWIYYTTTPAAETQTQEDFMASAAQTDFILSNAPVAGSVIVASGGLVQLHSQYSIVSVSTVRFAVGQIAGQTISVSYRY